MEKTVIFFDMDNTLIDRMEAAKKTYHSILLKSGIPQSDWEKVFELMWELDDNGEFPKKEIFTKVANLYDFDDAWINHMVEMWFDELPEFTMVFPKAVDTLKKLKTNYKIGMITNGSYKMQSRKIEVAQFKELFDSIVIAGEYGMAKPQKEIFEIACNDIGCTFEDAYFVGDSIVNDICGSKSVGMTPIYIWRDDSKPCEIDGVKHIYKIEELLEVIPCNIK